MIRLMKAYFRQRHYDKYIKSKEWKKLRLLVFNRDKNKCFLCDSKEKLECHHLYYDKNLYNTKMYQCVTLCKKHHIAIHKKAFSK